MPSPDRVYKKLAGQTFFLMLILEKNFFSHKYIILAMITLQNKVNFLLFLLHHFKCSYCFDFSYPLSSAQVSLDRATLYRQINRWKASTAAFRNTNDQENVQMWIEFQETSNFSLHTKSLRDIKCSVSFIFYKRV